MDENDVALFPVAGWEIGPIPSLGLVMIQPHFLTHPMQRPEEANAGRRYALTPLQARELSDALQRALAKLESAGPPTGSGPKH